MKERQNQYITYLISRGEFGPILQEMSNRMHDAYSRTCFFVGGSGFSFIVGLAEYHEHPERSIAFGLAGIVSTAYAALNYKRYKEENDCYNKIFDVMCEDELTNKYKMNNITKILDIGEYKK